MRKYHKHIALRLNDMNNIMRKVVRSKYTGVCLCINNGDDGNGDFFVGWFKIFFY